MGCTWIEGEKTEVLGLLLLRMDRVNTTVVMVHALFFPIVVRVKFGPRASAFLYVLVTYFLLQGAASSPCSSGLDTLIERKQVSCVQGKTTIFLTLH
jgi:sugar phosphate permease